MPNEQLAGHPHFSSDIYGVGVLGIQALTGLHPKNFSIDVRTSEILWHDRVPNVSPQFKVFLDRMVRYDFRDRYPTAKEALETLQNLSKIPLETSHSHSGYSQELPTRATHPQEGQTVPVTVPQSTQRQSLNRRLLPNQKQSFNPWPIFSVLASVAITFTLTKTFLPTVIEKTIYQFIHLPGDNSTQSPDAQATPSLLGSPNLDLSFPSPSPTPPASLIDPEFASRLAKLSLPQLLSEANRLRQAGKYQEALVAYDQAISRNSTIPEAHWGRCYSLNKLQNSKDALPACDRALALKPNYPEALSSKGYALERQKNYPQALQSAEQAIKLNPKFAEAWTNQGVVLLGMNRPTDALKAFEQATTLKPNYAEAWANRGAALWRLKRYDDAIASLDKALQIQPNYKNAINLRQQARTQLNNLPQE
ncbi:MAG TPA: tetratricopeptide repeat protein, partial [Cyanophyceae cyanobacterium]